MTPLVYTLTPEVLITMSRAHVAKSSKKMIFLVFLFAFVFGSFTSWMDKKWATEEFVYIPIGLMIVLIFAYRVSVAAQRIWLIPRAVRKNFALQKSLSSELTVSWDKDSLKMTSQNGVSNWLFSDFYRYLETDGHLMLYLGPQLYQPISSSAFESAAQRNELVHLLQEAGLKSR